MNESYIVICRENGLYVLATRTIFRSEDDAKRYASGVSESRHPYVVSGDFLNLRDDAKERFG